METLILILAYILFVMSFLPYDRYKLLNDTLKCIKSKEFMSNSEGLIVSWDNTIVWDNKNNHIIVYPREYFFTRNNISVNLYVGFFSIINPILLIYYFLYKHKLKQVKVK